MEALRHFSIADLAATGIALGMLIVLAATAVHLLPAGAVDLASERHEGLSSS
ncbi:MAG: hypothetical protein AB7U48_02335 [Bauldia sp.]